VTLILPGPIPLGARTGPWNVSPQQRWLRAASTVMGGLPASLFGNSKTARGWRSLGTSLVVSGEKIAYLQLRGGKQIEPMLTSKSLSPSDLSRCRSSHLGRMVRRPPRLVTWASAGRGAKMMGF